MTTRNILIAAIVLFCAVLGAIVSASWLPYFFPPLLAPSGEEIARENDARYLQICTSISTVDRCNCVISAIRKQATDSDIVLFWSGFEKATKTESELSTDEEEAARLRLGEVLESSGCEML